MFKNVEVLNKTNHKDLKFRPADNYLFAKGLASVPLSYTEMPRAAKYFPIIFSSQDGALLPQAVLSLGNEGNVFVDEGGRWIAPYVPVHIRRYPFILAKTGETDRFAVGIDMDAPQLGRETGDPLYSEDGEPTEVLAKIMGFLKRYHQELLDTAKLFTVLDEQQLFAERQFNIEKGGKKRAVRGFKAVDQEKLKALDDAILGGWVKKGVMGLVYAHLHSLENVQGVAQGK